MTDGRIRLMHDWGMEVVLVCCRYWKSHFMDGKWGTCGLCRQKPALTEMRWDDVPPVLSRG